MRRWAVLLAALLALGAAVPVVDAKPKQTKKQCLKAAKKKRTKAKRRAAKKRCLRKFRKHAASPQPAPGSPTAPGGAPPAAPGAPAPSDPGPAPEDPGPALPDDPSGGGRSVSVSSGEWWLRVSRSSVLAGDVRVEFDNSRGEDPHDLKLVRGNTVYSFDEQPSGAIAARTLHLSAGTWDLFCALPDHAQKGMQAKLSVTAG